MEGGERFIHIWNVAFPNYPLTLADVKKPHSMISALIQVFNSLGIDKDAVLSSPPEEEFDSHTIYYWDLIPIINITRVINHLLSVLQQTAFPLTISHFLQPNASTSLSVLMLLVNLIAFNEEKLRDIAPFEEELFKKSDKVKQLDDEKNQMLQMLNKQAEEKAKRGQRLQKIDHETKQFDDDFNQEKDAHNQEKPELESLKEEIKQSETLLEQKKSHRDALLAEIARKRALRVYDAEDIKLQAEQAAQNVEEAEKKLSFLKDTLMQKENSLNNLQKIKPNLDLANNLLHEVMKLSEGMKELESGDLDADSKDGELDVLNTELAEMQSQLAELQAAKTQFNEKRAENRSKRQLRKAQLLNDLRESEENEKKSRLKEQKSLQTIEYIKERLSKYEEEKKQQLENLKTLTEDFAKELMMYEEYLITHMGKAEMKMEDILKELASKDKFDR